jgi:transposase-like protein
LVHNVPLVIAIGSSAAPKLFLSPDFVLSRLELECPTIEEWGDTTKQRKHFTLEEKAAVLQRHLVEKVPISTICEEAAIRASQFYLWHKQFFENGAAAFQPGPRSKPDQAQHRIAAPEQKLQTKNQVLAELVEEFIALKISSNQ